MTFTTTCRSLYAILLEIVEFSLVYEISLITLICLNHMTFQYGRHMIPYFSRLSCITLFSFQGAIAISVQWSVTSDQ